jgi:aryl-alcohol dehydrogenase-like predicted oxidoreductase
MEDGLFDTILVGHNFLTPGPETDVFPLAEQTDTGVLVMCAVRRRIARPAALAELVAGLKAEGAIAADALPDDGPLDWLVAGDVRSVPDAAYRYVAMQASVDCVLTGTASADHLRANVAAVEAGPLPVDAVRRLQSVFGPVGRKLGD